MTTWAIAYATKAGVDIRSSDGQKIKVKSAPVGNMHAPDAQSFQDDFLARLTREDVVISPSGPNYTYLAGAYAHAGKVHWIDPGTLAAKEGNGDGKKRKKSPADTLLALFESEPQAFYEYKPTEARVAAIRIATLNWLAVERQATADGNAYSQLLKRERDFHFFADPNRNEWVKEYVAREKRKVVAKNKAAGVVLSKEQLADMTVTLTRRAEDLYESFFGKDGKEAKKVQDQLVRERLEWFGADELADDCCRRVKALLKDAPENEIFDGLIGPDALKTRAQVLAYMRSPRLYPCFPALASYVFGRFDEGQAKRRRRGMRDGGTPEFKRALVFDFADKYWQADPIGFFRGLYYTYKGHQYAQYWPLVELTRELWKILGVKAAEDGEDAEVEAEEIEGASGDAVRGIVEKLAELSYLPLIAGSPRARTEIAELVKRPDPKRLWRLFSKGNAWDGTTSVPGGNLQMPPFRIERQVKRLLGATLLQAAYYRWLAQDGEQLPLERDYIYVKQWRKVYGVADGVPTEYDHEVVPAYFAIEAERMLRERPLPPNAEIVCMPPGKRLEYLRGLDQSDRERAISALTEKEQKKLQKALAGEPMPEEVGVEA